MLIFISGGVRSSKSALGEKLADELRIPDGDKIYFATSMSYDDEMELRIMKHQSDRASKGFKTIEAPLNISASLGEISITDTVLLDCLGTLTANEMFSDYTIVYDESMKSALVEKIFGDILSLVNAAANVIVISNDIFSSGITYDPATEDYIDVLGRLHVRLAAISDRAVECVYGTNIQHK